MLDCAVDSLPLQSVYEKFGFGIIAIDKLDLILRQGYEYRVFSYTEHK
jgi:hypothetical protein